MANSKDLLGGAILISIGSATALASTTYKMGTIAHMGSGYFPFLVSVALVGLGLIVVVQGLTRQAETGVPSPIRALVRLPLLFLAIIVFALLIRPFGLVPAVVGLVVLGRLAGDQVTLAELALLCLFLILVAYLVFARFLGIPMQLWNI